MSYDIFAGILKTLHTFLDRGTKPAFSYRRHSSLDLLRERYGLNGIAGEGDSFTRANRLLCWLSGHIFHKGDYNGALANSLDLLEHSFGKGAAMGVNCRALSVILTECCLSLGITARTVYLMPLSPYDCDNHVVCEIWLPEQERWVMLDPTYGGYITDEAGTPFSVSRLRGALADRREIRFVNFSYHGDEPLDLEDLKAYYAKNLFYIKINRIQTFGSDQMPGNPAIVFVPLGYDPKEANRVKMDYLVSLWGETPDMASWRAAVLAEECICCPFPELDAAPEPEARLR